MHSKEAHILYNVHVWANFILYMRFVGLLLLKGSEGDGARTVFLGDDVNLGDIFGQEVLDELGPL